MWEKKFSAAFQRRILYRLQADHGVRQIQNNDGDDDDDDNDDNGDDNDDNDDDGDDDDDDNDDNGDDDNHDGNDDDGDDDDDKIALTEMRQKVVDRTQSVSQECSCLN